MNINKFEMREDGSMYDIDADIVCEKDTHKPIIIGKKGEMLKKSRLTPVRISKKCAANKSILRFG